MSDPASASVASAGSALPPKLVTAAHEFEAAMMKELLAPMVPGHDALASEDEAGSASALGDFAGEALGKAISSQGGFGIAKTIIHQVGHRQAGLSAAGKVVEGNQGGRASVPGGVTQNRAVFGSK
jgi:Rod binding domain-containing protein